MSSLVIGIAGGTGSGKTTLTQALIDAFPGKTMSLITTTTTEPSPISPTRSARGINWDAPDA